MKSEARIKYSTKISSALWKNLLTFFLKTFYGSIWLPTLFSWYFFFLFFFFNYVHVDNNKKIALTQFGKRMSKVFLFLTKVFIGKKKILAFIFTKYRLKMSKEMPIFINENGVVVFCYRSSSCKFVQWGRGFSHLVVAAFGR